MFDSVLIEKGVRLILEGLGVDPMDHNFDKTPARVAGVYRELFCPPESGRPVFDEHYTDIVVMRGHVFYTLCPHHMLPVKLTASIAYIPDGKVIGASKLMRMVHECNRYPMTQEKLTALIIDTIGVLTAGTSHGAAVLLKGEHGCFRIRGVRSDADMVTMKFSGLFEESATLQERFLRMVQS